MNFAQVERAEVFEQWLDGKKANGRIGGLDVLDPWQAVLPVFHAAPHQMCGAVDANRNSEFRSARRLPERFVNT
jgi:hypothetical protein